MSDSNSNVEKFDSALTAALLSGWRTIMLSAVAFGALLLVFALFVAKPTYRSTVTASPQGSSGDMGGLGALASSMLGAGALGALQLGGDDETAEHIAYLTSFTFLSNFAESSNAEAVLFPDAAEDEPVTMNDIVRRLRRSVISVQQDRVSGLVSVSVELRDRELAAQWANDLVDMGNQQIRTRDREDAVLSLKYLNDELSATSFTVVQQSISALIEAQVKRAMLAAVRPDYAFRVIDPAVASDEDDPVSPNVAGFTILGLLVGGFFGMCIALAMHARKVWKSGRSATAKE